MNTLFCAEAQGMDVQAHIAATVRLFRKRAGLSQAALAQEVGVGLKTISRIELGTFLPSLGTLVSLARALKCSVDELVGNDVSRPSHRGQEPADRLEQVEDRVDLLTRMVRNLAENRANALEDEQAVGVRRSQRPSPDNA